MSEYISKDDAKVLINLIKKYQYTIDEAKIYVSIIDRLNLYIKAPDDLKSNEKEEKRRK